jgi:SAM-dependent methyltransferase
MGFRATGVELSPAMLRRAVVNLACAGYPRRLVQADARRLPFPPEYFDTATVTFPTPVIRDPAFWLALGRILRPGGRVVAVLGARSGPFGNPTIVDFVAGLRARTVDTPVGATAPAARRVLSLPVPTDWFEIEHVDVEVDRSVVTLLIATKSTETGVS